MIKIEKTDVVGWEAVIRGMRNPMNSWEKIDSYYCLGPVCPDDAMVNLCKEECRFYKTIECENNVAAPYIIGHNDLELMNKLAYGGPVHAKYRRMITVYVDITAPLYWWKEFDTYKVGTVANSCSTMHKIHEKEFTLDDFSCEHLIDDWNGNHNDGFVYHDTGIPGYNDKATYVEPYSPKMVLELIIEALNVNRKSFLETDNKMYWWQMIQLLPSSYNQKRTVMLNYEVLVGIYKWRKNHKLDEWVEFCKWIEALPYSEIITMEPKEDSNG